MTDSSSRRYERDEMPSEDRDGSWNRERASHSSHIEQISAGSGAGCCDIELQCATHCRPSEATRKWALISFYLLAPK